MSKYKARTLSGAEKRVRHDRADAINQCLDWQRRYRDVNDQHAVVARALHAALHTGPSIADAAIALVERSGDMAAQQKEDAIATIKLWRAI